MTEQIDDLNEDWLRTRTWDLYRGSHLITTLEDFLWALNVENAIQDDQLKALRHAMSLPSWIPAPEALKVEVTDFIGRCK